MKVWQISEPFKIEEVVRPDKVNIATQAKVKVTKALLTNLEAHIYSGELKVNYPIVPGRFACGIVVETGEECFGFEKNQRVLLSGVRSCGECTNCKLGKSEYCTDLKIAGETCDGFLRDFMVVEREQIFALPPTVTDLDAVFIERLALAESVLDALNVSKGEHVAIIGAGLSGNLLCQLLIYKQIVPILIDDDEFMLDLAKKCGIYYTLKADENLIKNVMEITGGRMTHGAAFMNTAKLDPSVPFSLCTGYKNIVYAGFYYKDFTVNMEEAFKKHLTISEVTSGYGHIPTAINLLATKAVTTAKFPIDVIEAEDISSELVNLAEHTITHQVPLAIVNMLKPVA